MGSEKQKKIAVGIVAPVTYVEVHIVKRDRIGNIRFEVQDIVQLPVVIRNGDVVVEDGFVVAGDEECTNEKRIYQGSVHEEVVGAKLIISDFRKRISDLRVLGEFEKIPRVHSE